MKKVFDKINTNILKYDLIFLAVIIIVNFFLYLIDIRFRSWFLILFTLAFLIGIVIGLIQFIKKDFEKRKVYIALIIAIIIFGLFLLLFLWPVILFGLVISVKTEHTTILNNKKYVAVVSSFKSVSVDYYDYYGPIFMGTKVKVHGDFGKGGYDSFTSSHNDQAGRYTYYDEKGNAINIPNYDDKNYLGPKDEEVLYEKTFGNTILRYGKIDDVLGQNIYVNVLKSTDNGKTFNTISNEGIEVSSEAKFTFLNEQLGFVISNGQINLNNNTRGLYVTEDGGKTFTSAIFNYKNNETEYMNIDNFPYFENGKLKVKCSIDVINYYKDGYENVELLFISSDNGKTWIYEK